MIRRIAALASALIVLAGGPSSAAEQVGGERAFSFVALGDMPYNLPGDYVKFDRLIAAINAARPVFSVHVGDIISGATPCTDENFKIIFDKFQAFEQPLVYTPGDNEWVDCHRNRSGPNDPRERLAKLREMFFAQPGKTLGKSPMAVESQGLAMPTFAKFIENVRFARNDVTFATIHVPGSNNGFETFDPAAATEFYERDKANVAWLDDSFRKATDANAKAVIVMMQANPYDLRQLPSFRVPPGSGLFNTINAIERNARAFGKPVLVVQGDFHTMEVTAFRNTRNEVVPNVLRLQVMGEDLVHAVRVIVDPDSAGVFGFVPLIVPQNGPM